MSKWSFSAAKGDKPALSMSAQPQAAVAAAPKPAPIVFDMDAKKREQEEQKKAEQRRQEEEKRKKQEEAKQERDAKDAAAASVQAEKPQQSQPKKASKRPIETKEQREDRLKLWTQEEEAQREATKAEKTKEAKPLSIIISGHVDHGKSSMSGHILVNLQIVDERQVQKLRQEAVKTVGESWAYAFALDACQEEREKGITVESARATFTTPSGRRVVLLDSPGHKGFISSMIESAAQADAAVLVTSARKGEFEAGLERSGQTAEHALILFISGVRNLIVAINKMDDPTCAYDQGRFEQIKNSLLTYLTKTVGFQEKNIQFVPVSALTGENLTQRIDAESPLSKWYQGPCLIDLIDELKIPKRDFGGFMRACVSGKYRDQGYFAVIKVEKGIVRKGEQYSLMPVYEPVTILKIEDEVGNEIEKASAGENCRVQVDESAFEMLYDGIVLCDKKHPCESSKTFVAKFMCIDCPNVISAGFSCIVHVNTGMSECSVKSVVGVLDPKTGKIDKAAPKIVRPGQTALIEFECANELCINRFEQENFLGRILVRLKSTTVGIGQVVKVCYE